MLPTIDKVLTGRTIRRYMNLRGFSVMDIKNSLSLGCVQSVYHWLDGTSLPTLDNLYALSCLLGVPMDRLVCGTAKPDPRHDLSSAALRLLRYRELLTLHAAA